MGFPSYRSWIFHYLTNTSLIGRPTFLPGMDPHRWTISQPFGTSELWDILSPHQLIPRSTACRISRTLSSIPLWQPPYSFELNISASHPKMAPNIQAVIGVLSTVPRLGLAVVGTTGLSATVSQPGLNHTPSSSRSKLRMSVTAMATLTIIFSMSSTCCGLSRNGSTEQKDTFQWTIEGLLRHETVVLSTITRKRGNGKYKKSCSRCDQIGSECHCH